MITTPLLDDGNRASEDPLSQGGNWAEIVSVMAGPMLLTNPLDGAPALTGNDLPTSGSYRTDISLPAGDCEVWGIVGRCDEVSETIGLLLHIHDPGTSLDAYQMTVGDRVGNDWLLHRYTNGSATLLAQNGTVHPVQNDIILLRRVGNNIETWWYDESDGLPIQDPAAWTQIFNVNDTTHTQGTIGMVVATSDQEAYFRGFGGGVPVEFTSQVMRYM